MICKGGPLDGLLLHSTRKVWRMVTSKGEYRPEGSFWVWHPDEGTQR